MADVKRIMLVDDDEQLVSLLKLKIEQTNRYTVVFTTKGTKAVDMAKTENPDLILLDIDMPDMTGGEVAEALAESNDTRDIPILFLSYMVPKEMSDADGGTVSGRHMISKNTTVKNLIHKIDTLLE
jgi:two-component system sensor histidine kinase/response regulator